MTTPTTNSTPFLSTTNTPFINQHTSPRTRTKTTTTLLPTLLTPTNFTYDMSCCFTPITYTHRQDLKRRRPQPDDQLAFDIVYCVVASGSEV
eukprot:m.224154 g.224154  ORF g.224154 m.224154 type:complete len:92 (+) comp33421_c5_seq2:434-709(+)